MYEMGFACYLKYGRDMLEGKEPNPQDIDRTITYMNQALDNNPQLAPAMVILGFAHNLQGDKTRALFYLKKALLFEEQLGNQTSKIREEVDKIERL